jgi:hypothetical protein
MSYLRRHYRWFIATAILVAAGLAAWLLVAPDSSPYAKAVNRGIGAGVSVSGSQVPRHAKAVFARGLVAPFRPATPLAPAVQVTPSGRLPTPITLTIPLSRKVGPGETVVLATAESARAGWTMSRPTVMPGGRSVRVTTTHLSLFQPLVGSLQEVIVAFKEELKKNLDAITGDLFAEAQKPVCDGENQAREDGYSIASAGKGALYWCFGSSGGKRVLKIANRRRYALEVAHRRLPTLHSPPAHLELAQLAQYVSGPNLVVFSLDEADFTVALPSDGGTAEIETDASGLAAGLYALETGVTTLLASLDRFGAGSGTVARGDIIKTQFDHVTDVMNKVLGVAECARAVADFRSVNAGKLINGCLSPAEVLEMFGWKALLVAPVMAVSGVVEFFRSDLSGLGDQFTGRSRYRILIERTPSIAAYAGHWQVHGGAVDIHSDGTGQAFWNAGPCSNRSSGDAMCNGYARISFTPGQDGWRGRITSVWYRQWNGDAVPPDFTPAASDPRAGESAGTYALVAPGVLRNDIFGNPYLCRKDAAESWHTRCNA